MHAVITWGSTRSRDYLPQTNGGETAMKSSTFFKYFCGAALALFLLTAHARANLSWYDENPAVKPGIPDIGWVSSDPCLTGGDGYCGYVAAANVITYWDSHGLSNLVEDGTTADELMSQFIGYANPDPPVYGLTCDELERGLINYFEDKGYEWMVITQYNPPNINLALIEAELKKCEQVIVGTEKHWMTAAGWYDLGDQDWLGVYDPNPLQSGGKNLGGAEDYYQTSTTNGLSLFYNSWTTVDNVITVSIPDPASVTLVLLGLGTLGILRRRKTWLS